jgi:hypothetical protein
MNNLKESDSPFLNDDFESIVKTLKAIYPSMYKIRTQNAEFKIFIHWAFHKKNILFRDWLLEQIKDNIKFYNDISRDQYYVIICAIVSFLTGEIIDGKNNNINDSVIILRRYI